MSKCEHGLTIKECYVCMSPKYAERQQALDKKAENARELGLDYESPKREWISLTLDEIWEVYKKHDSMQYMAFARAIEQALKEKNT